MPIFKHVFSDCIPDLSPINLGFWNHITKYHNSNITLSLYPSLHPFNNFYKAEHQYHSEDIIASDKHFMWISNPRAPNMYHFIIEAKTSWQIYSLRIETVNNV